MLYLSAIVLSFFLGFLLLTKKRKSIPDKILATWLATIGTHLFMFYLYITGKYQEEPWIMIPGFALPLAHGPFLFLYTSNNFSSRRFRWLQLLHFLPVLASLMLFSDFFLMTKTEQLTVISQKGSGYEWRNMINLLAIYVSGLVYIPLSLYRLLQYRKNMVQQFSNTEKINFNWLLYLVLWMVAIWLLVMIVGRDEWTFGFVAVFVAWLGYFGIRQVQVFSTPMPANDTSTEPLLTKTEMAAAPDTNSLGEPEKYSKSLLSEKDAANIHQRLLRLFENEQPYTNPDLTLTDLARSMQVHPNVLSQVINSREKKSFYDLVNEKRVEEFIRLSASPSNKQYTLLSLAFECGFNSKASFNRNFKKHKGQTPREFLKKEISLN